MQQAELVERLHNARLAGDFAPEWLNGALTLDEALDVQLALLERELAAGERLAGWKVGLTSERARKALGQDERPFGYLRASRVQKDGAEVDVTAIASPSIEPELCFTIAERIPGRVEPDRVARSLARVSAGFELNERRPGSARPDFPALVTDCLTQWGIVVGEGLGFAESPPLGAVRCTLRRDGEEVYSGLSRDELDDHLESIARLAGGLAAHGRALEPGQQVITGAFARFDAQPGELWRADYAGIGSVQVRFR